MGFQDKQQRDHMLRGVHAAVNSPNTPAHLKPHLAKRLGGNMAYANTPRPKGVSGPGAINQPRPKGVGGVRSVNAKRPGAPGPGSITTPSPKGVGSAGPARAKLGSAGNANGLPNVKSVPGPQPVVQSWVQDVMSPGQQEPPNLRTKASGVFQRSNQRIGTIQPRGFKKNSNLPGKKVQPNSFYGEV